MLVYLSHGILRRYAQRSLYISARRFGVLYDVDGMPSCPESSRNDPCTTIRISSSTKTGYSLDLTTQPSFVSPTIKPSKRSSTTASPPSHHCQLMPPLLRLVVAVPALLALSPLKSLTHFKLAGLAVSLALYVHLPSPPSSFTIALLTFPLSTSVIPLLSPFRTFDVQVTAILPDCRDSQV